MTADSAAAPGAAPIRFMSPITTTEWGRPSTIRARCGKPDPGGFQAGLSWITILRKREAFRAAFAGFDPAVHRRPGARPRCCGCWPIRASSATAARSRPPSPARRPSCASRRARAFRRSCGACRRHSPSSTGSPPGDVASRNRQRRGAMSKALKAEGFKFCGPTITYAFMQAVGMVNDHLVHLPMPPTQSRPCCRRTGRGACILGSCRTPAIGHQRGQHRQRLGAVPFGIADQAGHLLRPRGSGSPSPAGPSPPSHAPAPTSGRAARAGSPPRPRRRTCSIALDGVAPGGHRHHGDLGHRHLQPVQRRAFPAGRARTRSPRSSAPPICP